MIRRKLIRETVERLLNKSGTTEAPVDVEAIASQEGALVTSAPNEEDVSGFLLHLPGNAPIIGVNTLHHAVRKRFTVAHELGHLMLHSKTELHIDRLVVKMRDRRASEGTDHEEIEANRFAAEILMPEEFLRADLINLGPVTADDDQAISNLATRYKVSKQAMTIRLTSLGLIWM